MSQVGEHALVYGDRQGLQLGVRPEFAERLAMWLRIVWTLHDQAFGDGRVGQTLGHQRQHLPLALGQLREGIGVARPSDESGDDRRVEDGLSFGDPAQRVGQDGDVGYCAP